MFEESNKVFWIDITNCDDARMTTISELYQHVSHLGILDEFSKYIYVDLSSENIKIRDWYGWTQLLDLEKHIIENGIISEISVNDMKIPHPFKLYVDHDCHLSVFPKHNVQHPSKGFHGEVIFHPVVKKVEDITDDDTMRVYGRGEQFSHVKCETSSHGPCVVYKIRTKSGMFNCSNFYVMDNYFLENVEKRLSVDKNG